MGSTYMERSSWIGNKGGGVVDELSEVYRRGEGAEEAMRDSYAHGKSKDEPRGWARTAGQEEFRA